MIEILQSLRIYVAENWPELVWIVIAAALASYIAGRRSRIQWRSRSFLDRLNVSLNTITEDALRIRTILEMDIEAVFLNRTAATKIKELAQHTTAKDPMIGIPRDDCWYYLNAVLNEISERFSVGYMRRDAGLEAHSVTYLICLTCEQAGQARTHKIRVMLIQKSALENLPAEAPELEQESHITRWHTLQALAERYAIAPHYFLEMEVIL